jgi:hypothetical protein
LRIAFVVVLLICAPALVVSFRLLSGHSRAHTTTPSRHTARLGPNDVISPAAALDRAIRRTDGVSSYEWSATGSQSGTGSSAVIASSGSASLAPVAIEETTTSPYGDVALRIDDTSGWYYLNSGNSVPPATASGWSSPTALSALGATGGGAIGAQLQALALLGACSPFGELDLSAQAVASATPVGSVVVNGQSVEEYEVSIATGGFLGRAGTTVEQEQALEAAVDQLGDQPLTATVDVAPDGYIVRVDYTVTFANESSVSSDTTFSAFNQPVSISMPASAPPVGSSGAVS